MALITKYGAQWEDNLSALEIEMQCIAKGGKWIENGVECGVGTFKHMYVMQMMIWPEDDHNRWSNLILNNLINERIIVVTGSKDSGKTRTVSKWVLCDYWCNPEETLTLMTSTTALGLEMRVWGDIKSLFMRGKDRYDWLPGNVVDAKKGIFTQDITDRREEVRDMRQGVVGIPVMTGEGDYQGMALKNFAGIKQKRRRLVGDELQFLSCDYLKTLDAMDKGEFKGIFLGNPIANNGKALDKVSEPANGWGSLGEVTKTKTWRNRYHGITLNLVGIDSPNFDPDTLDRYPYLPNHTDLKRFENAPGGKDSLEWWSLFMGVRKAGMVVNRVLTTEMVRNNGGFKDIIWSVAPTMKIYAVDAGYGGDECVSTFIECGTEVGGQEVMVFREQKVIPVTLTSPITPEDQIATFAKQECSALGVPDSNVFIEAGMRATLAVSFGRIMSPAINAINFGGTATSRPVSNDLFINDEKTQTKRLKTCYEHYSKFVTELAFSVRAVVESGQARLFPLAAAEEFERREWRFVYGDRYELESKIEYKDRNSGKSPNWSDSTMVAVEGARRLGFVIERLKDPNEVADLNNDWMEEEVRTHNKVVRKQELNYF